MSKKKKQEIFKCEICQLIGSPNFSILRFPMPVFCSEEHLKQYEENKRSQTK